MKRFPPLSTVIRVIALLFLLIVAAFFGYRFWAGEGGDQVDITLYGNIDLREVELAFMVQERITHLYVDEGVQVKSGQLLAEVDAVRFEQAVKQREAELEGMRQQLAALEHGSRPEEVRQAQAELEVTEATLRDAKSSYQRIQRLVNEKLASPQQADDAKATLDAAYARLDAAHEKLKLVKKGPREEDIAAARAKVNGAEATLVRAHKDLRDTRLFASSDGIIQARILETGDIAAPNKPVFTLALTDPLWVRAYVSESELGKLSPGMAARIYSDTFPDKIYQGHIGYISPTAEFTPKTVQTTDVRSSLVYMVRVLVSDPNGELRLGMPVTVVIPLEPAAAEGDEGRGAR